MSDLLVSSLVTGGIIAVINVMMVRRSATRIERQTSHIETLVNGHSTAQAAEISRLRADVVRLLKLLPPGTEEGATP
jgi:hypothetical protein